MTDFDPTYQADLLSACYTNKERFIQAREFVDEDTFTIPECRWLWQLAAHSMDERGELPSSGLVVQEARSSFSEDELPTLVEVHRDIAGGRSSPKSIMDSAIKFAEQARYADIARRHDKMIEAGKFSEARALMESQEWKIKSRSFARRLNYGYDDFEKLTANAKSRRDDPQEFKLSTGIKDLDERMDGGYPRGDFVLVLGWTGRGKSTLAINLAHSNLKRGMGGLYLPSEMRDEIIASKFFARGSRIGQNVIHEYRFTPKEEAEYLAFMEKERERMQRLLMIEQLGTNSTTRDKILRAVDEAHEYLADFSWICVDTMDHCQHLPQYKRDPVKGYGDNMNWLSEIADELDIAALVTSQSNRGGADRTELENAANTSEGIRVAQWVIAVNEDKSKTQPDPEDGIDELLSPVGRFDSMTLSLLKARSGRPGDVTISSELGCSFMGDYVIDKQHNLPAPVIRRQPS